MNTGEKKIKMEEYNHLAKDIVNNLSEKDKRYLLSKVKHWNHLVELVKRWFWSDFKDGSFFDWFWGYF